MKSLLWKWKNILNSFNYKHNVLGIDGNYECLITANFILSTISNSHFKDYFSYITNSLAESAQDQDFSRFFYIHWEQKRKNLVHIQEKLNKKKLKKYLATLPQRNMYYGLLPKYAINLFNTRKIHKYYSIRILLYIYFSVCLDLSPLHWIQG